MLTVEVTDLDLDNFDWFTNHFYWTQEESNQTYSDLFVNCGGYIP